jgi:hypothetical protein
VDSFFERFARDPGASALTDQKFIVYPADFVGTNYTILDADKGKSLVIINYCSYYNNTSSSSVKDASWLYTRQVKL